MLRKISLWLLPSPEEERNLRASIETLSHQLDTFPFSPHLTLYSPILAVPTALKAELEPICHKMAPFCIESQGLGHSDAYYRAIVIESQTSPALKQWHGHLRSRWNPTDQRSFAPHISLVYKEMSANKRRELLDTISYQSTYHFDRLSAIATETTDPARQQYQEWEVLWTIPLAGKNPPLHPLL